MHLQGLGYGSIGVNIKEKTATVVDSGNERFYASNLSHIGKAVAAILSHPDETANRYLATASFNPSQNEIIAIIEELTGSKLTIHRLRSDDLYKSGEEKLARADYSAFVDFLKVHNHADGAGNDLKDDESANGLLGLPQESLRDTIEKHLKRVGAI